MTETKLTLDDEAEIDRICLAFEAAFRAGERPEIGAYLERASERLRAALGAELVPLDGELRATVLPVAVLEGPLHAPTRIGRYEVVRKLGEGGMGTVYEAMQDHPRRRVAVKVVRADLVGPRLAKRFRREVGLLGHLHHPCIAQIFEAGTARADDDAEELPYLVMEYVPGEPLLEHARSRNLSLNERLALAVQICSAVQHAHDQGVIHRDLKPANVLVRSVSSSSDSPDPSGRHAGGDRPVVVDFGLAKATGRGAGRSMDTQLGQIVGTLSHMSPEQISGKDDQVDERSDVYALGVVLYELLSGQLPLDLRGRNVHEAVETIHSTDPKRLGAVDSRLRGDLEIIVAKALEKDKARRYPTAAELGADLQRFLDREPIRARTPSAIYQLRKFARRNPVLVSGLGAAAALLLVALGFVSFSALRERQLREAAVAERSKVAAVAEFQRKIIESANLEDGGTPRETTLFQVLGVASNDVDGAFPDAPLVEAAVRVGLGRAFLSMSAVDESERHFQRAYDLLFAEHGDRHEDTHEALRGLARSVEFDQRFDEALKLQEKAVEIARGLFGEADTRTLSCWNNLATTLEDSGDQGRALEIHRRVLSTREREFGPTNESVANSLNNLATLLETADEMDEARDKFQRCLAIRRELYEPPHKLLGNVLNNLGVHFLRRGDIASARPYLAEALEMRERLFGPEHADVGTTVNNLAVLENLRGDFGKAAEYMERAMAVYQAQYGADHPQALVIRANVVILLKRSEQTSRAYDIQKESVDIHRATFGEEHVKTLLAVDLFALTALEDGRTDEAREIATKNLSDARRLFPGDYIVGRALETVAELQLLDGDPKKARASLGEARVVFLETAPSETRELSVCCRIIEVLIDQGVEGEAMELARETHPRCLEVLGPEHRTTKRCAALLDGSAPK